jgi:hypothetical protein
MKYMEYLKSKGEDIGDAASLGSEEALSVISAYALFQKRPEPITEFILEAAVVLWQKVYKMPEDGGCWYCFTNAKEMLYDEEFDTYFHKKCLDLILKKYPNHEEALAMKELLEEEE